MEARVATTADSYMVRRAPANAPISAHPAFPAIVALWFAALLGLGMLVLPVALLERLVTAIGLDRLIASAEPPLGFASQAGVALGGAIAGALIGLWLARKVVEAHAPAPRGRQFAFDEALHRRPISAHDELGEEGLGSGDGAEPAQSHKRRSLAIAEEASRSTYLQTVPLPGARSEDPTGKFAPPPVEEPEVVAPEPLELSEFADVAAGGEDQGELEVVPAASDPALDALRSRIHLPTEPSSPQDQPMTDRRDTDTPQAFEPAPDAANPLPFAAPSLRRAAPIAFELDNEFDTQDEVEQEVEARVEDAAVPHLCVIEPLDEPEMVDEDRPLAELGLVQLAARLGASLQKRKARLAAPLAVSAPSAIPPLAGAEDFEAAEAEEAARAIADFFGPASSGETAEPEPEAPVRAAPFTFGAMPLDDDEELDDDSLAASLSLPRVSTASAPEPVDEDEAFEDDDSDEGDYSSLLAMKNPFLREQEFVRVDEPEDDNGSIEPTVTFPSAAPAQASGDAPRPFDPPRNRPASAAQAAPAAGPRDSGDAERNLRAALATLQRMGGAA